MAHHKDAQIVLLPCALEDKALLIEAAPEIDFETHHYWGWPLVLAKIDASRTRDCGTGWRLRGGWGDKGDGEEAGVGRRPLLR